MLITFVEQIASVARRIKRRRWATAACWALAATIATLLVLMALDRLFGVHHIAGRLAWTALLLAAIVFICRRTRRSIDQERATPLGVALELERLYPEHRGLLASGLEFSQQEAEDVTAGSLDLRRAAVLRASLAVESIDLAAAVPRRPLRRALAAAIAAIAMISLPAIIAPQTFAIGVTRLINPLSDAEWPRRHDLAFVDPPELIPAGSDFVTHLRDRNGKLPPSVEVEFRTRRQGRWQYQSQTFAASAEAIEIRRPNVQQAFEYRARGGDHTSMPWRRVETAPAPQVRTLSVTAHPPAYTGLHAEKLSEPLRVMARTRLELRGAANRAVESARLEAAGEEAVALQVGEDGRSFATPPAGWIPKTSAEWSITFTTVEGTTAIADRQLFVEVTPDRAPTVEILQPMRDLAVLPEAAVDISLAADDDRAVKTVSLGVTSVSLPDQTPVRIELYQGAERAEQGPRTMAHTLELSSLAPHVGTEWQVVAHASDYAGQEATSVRPLRLRVISDEDFINRADGLFARLSTAVERSLTVQQESQSRVEDLLGDGTAAKGSTAANAASLQRDVRQAVAGNSGSAIQLAELLAAEYRRNRWPDRQALILVESVLAMLKDLAVNQLAAAEEALTQIARAAHSSPDPGPLTDTQLETLANVRVQQHEIIAALESILENLSQATEIQQFQRDLAELKREQSELLTQTEELAREALLNRGEPASPQRQGRQQALDRQRQLAAGLAAMLGRMKQSADQLADSKPGDALRLEAANTTAERSQLQQHIREAADQLAASRFGQATSAQRQVVEQLQQTLDQMTEGGYEAAGDRLAALEAAEQQLDAIRRKVDSKQVEASQRTRRELAERTKQLARELERIRADAAAQPAAEAAEHLAKSDVGSPESRLSAEEKLEDAQQRLAAERRRQEALLTELDAQQRGGDIRRSVEDQRPNANQTAGKRGMKPGEAAGVAKTQAAGEVDRAAIGNLVKDIWGRLPERQREELLQPLSEEFLPEYADEIEEYFRVLAETPPEGRAEEKQR